MTNLFSRGKNAKTLCFLKHFQIQRLQLGERKENIHNSIIPRFFSGTPVHMTHAQHFTQQIKQADKNAVPSGNQCPPHIPILMTQETVYCQNKVMLLPMTAPIQLNMPQSRSEKEQSFKSFHSSCTSLNTAIIYKLIP